METGELETGRLALSWAIQFANRESRNQRCMRMLDRVICGRSVTLGRYEDQLVIDRARELGFKVVTNHDMTCTIYPRTLPGWRELGDE